MAYSSARDSLEEKLYKMVVIGETGSGKTCFIQLLLNYAAQYGKEFDLEKVSSFVTRNPVAAPRKKWESDTIETKKYKASFGDFKLHIIDTPGFGDTGGEDQREANIADIICKIKEEYYLNCICIVINGTSNRMSTITRLVIRGIVSVLPAAVLQNIIIVFTNTQDKHSLSFKVEMLKEYDLTVPERYTFIFDNPYARWINTKDTTDCTPRLVKKIIFEFEDTIITLQEIFEVIKKLKPAKTLKFGEFYEVVKEIETCLTQLHLHHVNKGRMEVKLEELKNYLRTNENIVEQMETTYEKIEVRISSNKHVVCNSMGCYSNCHMNCDCWFTFFTVRACKVIENGKCTNCSCGHPYGDHCKNMFYFETVTAQIPLPPNLKSLAATVKENRNLLDIKRPALSTFETTIAEATKKLENTLKRFQSIGSSTYFSTNAIEQIEYLKKKIKNIPNFESTGRVIAMFDATIQVLKNPIVAKDDETKFRWACGVLEMDPTRLTDEEVSRLFREQSRRFHPDSPGAAEASGFYKYVNHAKEYLITRIAKLKI